MTAPALSVDNLSLAIGDAVVVDGIGFSVAQGEVMAIVGESGCGKSTVSNATVGLVSPTSGSVRVLGTELAGANARTLRAVRARAQMV